MIKIIAPFILSILISYFAHAQSCKSILGASINIKTILMEIASLSQDVEQAKLSGDTTAFISLESSLKEKTTEVLSLGIISDEELKLSLNNQSEELIKKTKKELKEKKEKREIQNELLKIENFINRLRSESNIVSWFNDFKNLNEVDQKTIVTKLDILKNQDKIIARKIEEISLIWNTDLEIYKEVLKSELIKTINLNARNNIRLTSMRWAIANEQKEFIEFLIQYNADVNAKDNLGRTDLHFAVEFNKGTIVELLIQNGADVNAKDNQGNTPLHSVSFVKYGNKKELIKLLVKNNADVNAKNNKGETPLHLTFDPETIELLIQSGADVNARNNKGYTLLHLVFFLPDGTKEELLKLLVKNSADVNAKDNKGNTSLHRTVLYERKDIIKLLEFLIQNGANVNAVNNNGETTLDLANSFDIKDSEVVKFLETEMAKP